jgi:hypothetical protein
MWPYSHPIPTSFLCCPVSLASGKGFIKGEPIKQYSPGQQENLHLSPDPSVSGERWDPRELLQTQILEETNDSWRWGWQRRDWDRRSRASSESLPRMGLLGNTHRINLWTWPSFGVVLLQCKNSCPLCKVQSGWPCLADRLLFRWPGIFILLCFH